MQTLEHNYDIVLHAQILVTRLKSDFFFVNKSCCCFFTVWRLSRPSLAWLSLCQFHLFMSSCFLSRTDLKNVIRPRSLSVLTWDLMSSTWGHTSRKCFCDSMFSSDVSSKEVFESRMFLHRSHFSEIPRVRNLEGKLPLKSPYIWDLILKMSLTWYGLSSWK